MPYYRRRNNYKKNYNNKRNYYRQQKLSINTVKTIARKEARTVYPLQWIDFLFTGGNVNTTPTMHSLTQLVCNTFTEDQIRASWQYLGSSTNYQARYAITYVRMQLRFQQDVENIESSNTFRTVLYGHEDSFGEHNEQIFAGLDVDSPPDTGRVTHMYMDRIRTLRAGTYDPTNTDEADPTPGTAIVKYAKKLYHPMTLVANGNFDVEPETGDLRWEAQSDSVGSGLQLYGFIRVYYRRLQ